MKAIKALISNYSNLLPEMRRYYYPLEIFYFSFTEIWLKFRTSCQDRQAGESAVKCLSFGHSKMARVGFERDHVDHNHSALTT